MTQSSILPDPTADLHWSQFAGAIQDIFAENATKNPDRVFIVETASSSVQHRNFTYWQIHQASNIIAHRLLQDGIQRGDVVMIYAYRGVDLVVAVLGTLKAGAAFSVVDPAYPSDRQKIYLDVARPRALIVIAKASREDGRLSEDVEAFVESTLDIRTRIPALELLDDGSLVGGPLQDGATDVLEDQRNLKDNYPGVVVGPDTQPTLSFTSGSEGIPKGCRGRHFSLTYYQAFMAERFRMGAEDRFTMLSGIAHDPIQRDIFTPAYLGATLLIPAKEDIAHERLAEWMRTYEPTVTHLTPAMGQILVGGASAEFPSLRVTSLSSVTVGHYKGTTETQRAVSFYEIPSRTEDPDHLTNMGDVIPAGRGMKDVQLLVVNRESLTEGKPRLCGVGEIGELFVRAGGLAEGYLGSDALNKEKFVPNFFAQNDAWEEADRKAAAERGCEQAWRQYWQGPRDRLYRSGDLGRYTEMGEVECTGRADSQIKIRGFRIELGEIDTHLSHHPLVRENVTLVRRDKDEEPTLVSYIVPDMPQWPQWLQSQGLPEDKEDDTMVGMLKRFRALRDDVRVALKKRLPIHAMPSVIIPLQKMPLTPNAKIDKRALPYPDAAQLAEAMTAGKTARANFSPTERYVGEVWAKRIPGILADAIDLDDRFFDVGGHSMAGQSVLFDIRKDRKVALSMNTLFQNPSLRGFASVLDAASELATGDKQDSTPPEMDYHLDGEIENAKFHGKTIPSGENPLQNFFVTGATGFLGAHILADLLGRTPRVRVYAHVRAPTAEQAFARIKESCEAYGVWDEDWLSNRRLEFVIGDLSKPNLGIDDEKHVWNMLANSVDVIIHNGARVHWVHSYSYLKPVNVNSTISCLNLCSIGRPKHLTFISSTAVLDTPFYTSTPTSPILESDTLSRSRTGLSNGYGQTKYVSEYLLREAGARGLRGSIIRPGYITGDPSKGIGPTDDFLLRMLKGSIQLHSYPDLSPNGINLVPVSHCARIVVAASFHPPSTGVQVLQITPHPHLPFNDFLSTPSLYGYNCPQVPYPLWKARLETYVATSTTTSTSAITTSILSTDEKDPHALLPLFDWVTSNLPHDTASHALDDTNAARILHLDDPSYDIEKQSRVTRETVAMYLGFMGAIGFISPPPPWMGGEGREVPVGERWRELPVVEIGEEQREALARVGRGGGK